MDKEIIQKARQANLAEYLLSVGVPLICNGIRHKHKEHESLIFTENSYYWNSQQEHGNAVDYLVKHMGMTFADAVSALTGVSLEHTKLTDFETFNLEELKLLYNRHKVKRYLNETRLINYDLICNLIENKLLVQEERTNNAIFLMYDENNVCVGAEAQGTIPAKRFKGIKANSKYGYGFNLRFSDCNEFDYALFFESAIDLVSFVDYETDYKKKSLERCFLVSMSGLKINVLKHTLKAFRGSLKPVLCVDNDEAGRNFLKEAVNEKIPFMTCLPDEGYKDWNEQLKGIKRYIKPITRLLTNATSG